MADVLTDPTRRAAGQHVRASSRRLRLRTLAILGVIAIASAAGARELGVRDLAYLALELVLAFALLAVAHYAVPLVHRREIGAGGEEHVGSVLATLGEEWSVIHDAHIASGNIDHIVIGPGGIFAIETKARGGNVRVRDVHGATLHRARSQRRALEEITGCAAEPLLVFSRAWVDRPLARRGGVRVLPARMLAKHLRARPAVLEPHDVQSARERIGEHLREHLPAGRAARSVALWR
jgi:hypothetical protein